MESDDSITGRTTTEGASTSDCPFCRIASSEPADLPEYDRPIIETAEFIIVPALGQFVEGYLLIAPREHRLNIGVLPDDMLLRFNKLKADIRELLADHGAPVGQEGWLGGASARS